MVEAAREALPTVVFEEGDLETWTLPDAEEESSAPDLIFTNAVLHWLRERERQATLGRLERELRPWADKWRELVKSAGGDVWKAAGMARDTAVRVGS